MGYCLMQTDILPFIWDPPNICLSVVIVVVSVTLAECSRLLHRQLTAQFEDLVAGFTAEFC
jgi:hypothetical protein